MTREEFIELLEEKRYSYEIVGDKIVVNHKNKGSVDLSLLESLPPGMEFNNGGSVYLESLESLTPGVEFKNGGDIVLKSLKTISPGVEFRNGRSVYLESLIGGWIGYENYDIEEVDSKSLLNLMIKQGVFI